MKPALCPTCHASVELYADGIHARFKAHALCSTSEKPCPMSDQKSGSRAYAPTGFESGDYASNSGVGGPVRPDYYGVGTPYEVIPVLQAWGLNAYANLWNVVKYVARFDKKGDKLENLKKARHYLQMEIDYLENGVDEYGVTIRSDS